jgi:pyruvate/2-oxoglutarate dehydrogenase complex dihydrolipoamide dehydrogenase (E3) component
MTVARVSAETFLQDMQPLDAHNRALLANVHPLEWKNPEPARRYNLVVIGAGTAGLVAAAGAATLGARVALIEKRLLGGDCLNFGCVPSKALLRCARARADVREAGGFGIVVPEGARADFGAVMERMRALRARIAPHDSAERLRSLGVDVFFGEARFLDRETIEVDGRALRFRKACVATGARPSAPDLPGLAEAGYLTNETVFSLTERPARLAVIGAGPVGCELAQAFARLGSRVWLLQRGDRVLPQEEEDAAAFIERALREDRVELLLGSRATGARRTPTGKTLTIQIKDGTRDLEVDEILVGVGRTPNVDGLDLEAAGVKYDARRGVDVNDRLQTSHSDVYAAGDVCSRYQFTHVADAMARIVVRNALFFGRARTSALTIPWCTYTDPEIAHVGLGDREAAERGLDIDTIVVPMPVLDRAVLDGEEAGLLKVHHRKGSDRIVGATLVARHAGEMISELTVAIEGGIGLRGIGRTIHPYPTQAEVFRKAADAYERSRLTPRVRRVLKAFLAWRA